MKGRINLLLRLDLSKDQGSRKCAWKQGPGKEFLWNNQVLIMDVRRNYEKRFDDKYRKEKILV